MNMDPDAGGGDGVLMGLPEYYGADVHSPRTNVCFMFLVLVMWLSIAGFVLSNVRHQNR